MTVHKIDRFDPERLDRQINALVRAINEHAEAQAAGISVVVVTAKLTTLGTEGSQTFTGGILTAQVQAT